MNTESTAAAPLLWMVPHGATHERNLAFRIVPNIPVETQSVTQILCDGPILVCDRVNPSGSSSRSLGTCSRCLAEQRMQTQSEHAAILLGSFLKASDRSDVGQYLRQSAWLVSRGSIEDLPAFDGIRPSTLLRSPLAHRFPELLTQASENQGLRDFLTASGIALFAPKSTPIETHSYVRDFMPHLEASLLCLRAFQAMVLATSPTMMLVFGASGLISAAAAAVASLNNIPFVSISCGADGSIRAEYSRILSKLSPVDQSEHVAESMSMRRIHLNDDSELVTLISAFLNIPPLPVLEPGDSREAAN